jgi:tetratricopeptide (TPR) repeat protein
MSAANDRRQGRRDREREAMLARLATVASSAPVAETVLFGLAVSAAMLGGWLAAIDGRIDASVAAAIHAASVAVLLGWVWTVRRRKRDLRLPYLLAGTAALTGPFGGLGSALCAALYAIFRRRTTGFEEWYAALFPEQKIASARALFQEIVGDDADEGAAARSVASFTDILAFGTFDQKQALLALIATYFKPAFAPALKAALAHDEPAIRVQAATAVAQIEQRFMRRSVDLENELARRPADVPLLGAAARHYDDYAFTGLLDSDRQEENRKRALALYGAALELAPDNAALELATGRLLVRQGAYREAGDLLSRAAEAGRLPPVGAVWYLECLFQLRAFDRLRIVARQLAPLLDKDEAADPVLRDATRLWAMRAAA